jgi:hypothetical protein
MLRSQFQDKELNHPATGEAAEVGRILMRNSLADEELRMVQRMLQPGPLQADDPVKLLAKLPQTPHDADAGAAKYGLTGTRFI